METKTIEVDLIEHTAEEPISEENSVILKGDVNTLEEQQIEETEQSDSFLKEVYLRQIEDYCNVVFNTEDIPSGVLLALNELVKTDPARYNITSEKLSDMSITYNNSANGIPAYIRVWIEPYRRPHLVGNKRKRLYNNGRG